METEEAKPWYQSRGVIGGIVAAIAGIAAVFKVNIAPEMQSVLVDGLIGLAGAVGGILAVIGRIKASKKVS